MRPPTVSFVNTVITDAFKEYFDTGRQHNTARPPAVTFTMSESMITRLYRSPRSDINTALHFKCQQNNSRSSTIQPVINRYRHRSTVAFADISQSFRRCRQTIALSPRRFTSVEATRRRARRRRAAAKPPPPNAVSHVSASRLMTPRPPFYAVATASPRRTFVADFRVFLRLCSHVSPPPTAATQH